MRAQGEIRTMKRTALALLLFGLFIALAGAATPTDLKGHSGLVYSGAFTPDGKWPATAGFDNTVKFWDCEAGKEVRTLAGHPGAVYCVAFNKDGTLLASSSLDQTIRIWNVAD